MVVDGTGDQVIYSQLNADGDDAGFEPDTGSGS